MATHQTSHVVLIPFFIKCQWLVPKFKCKVYQNGKNRSSKQSVSSLCLAGAVTNVADSNRCNPKVPSSIPAGVKDFP